MSGCGQGEPDDESIADNDAFVAMMHAAEDDNKVKTILIAILSLDHAQRDPALRSLLADMQPNKAPSDFILAIAAFLNPDVADKALKLLTGQKTS
jgi:hypothetical protein